MPSDYDKIRHENIKGYGTHTHHLLFLGELYTERTHFVFELLQNAEDAGATRILFTLFEDRLEVAHDGRPFNEKDVRSICGVGEGTKARNNLTQIGKFGIGFKSVYAYTNEPEVHSGDESFRIKHYVRPFGVSPRSIVKPWTTLFDFKFGIPDVPSKKAYDEIGEALRNLDVKTLLFLRKIKEIKYKISGLGTSGVYLRGTSGEGTARRVKVARRINGLEDNVENWLIFSRPVAVPSNGSQVSVEIGFRLDLNTKDNTEGIVVENNTSLVVYFLTEKPTELGFLVQGPYRTTPARDNVPGYDTWNMKLIEETAELVVDSLRYLKKVDLLSVALLEALPIRSDDFPEDGMFYPIFRRVRKALKDEELLPTSDGSFVAARNAKLFSAMALIEILGQDQRAVLFRSRDQVKWLSDKITERRTRDLHSYLKNVLEVEEVTPGSFARKITEQFLDRQSDEWFIVFYEFLTEHSFLWRSPRYWSDRDSGVLRNKPILRLQDGTHVKPFNEDGTANACWAEDETDIESSLPIVKIVLSQHEGAREFLVKLGMQKLDVVEVVVNSILPKYQNDSVNVEFEDNTQHLRQISRAYETDSREKKERLREAFCKSRFILADLPNKGERAFLRPSKVYFASRELQLYFSENSSFSCVCPDNRHAQMLKDLGVVDHIRITCKSRLGSTDPVPLDYDRGYRRGLQGFDPNIEVDGLEKALATPSIKKSQMIWNRIACSHWHCIRGKVVTSSRRDFSPDASTYNEKKVTSLFGKLLIGNAWIPDLKGNMCRPDELSLNDLHESLDRNERLAVKLGMRISVDEELVKKANISKNVLNLARQIENAPPEDQKRINDILQKSQSQFPQRGSADSERRTSRTAAEYQNAPAKEYETRDRSVRTSRGEIDSSTFLRNQYTNDDDQMICQICQKEMPFRKRDGEYYFEAVEAFSEDHFRKEHEAQFVALCPTCAARYKEFIKQDGSAMQKLCVVIRESNAPEIPLILGELSTSIRFVETHWQDLKMILGSV